LRVQISVLAKVANNEHADLILCALGKRKRQLPSDLTENGLPRNVKQSGQKELAEIWSGPVISVVG
jgi:hypothetical protein